MARKAVVALVGSRGSALLTGVLVAWRQLQQNLCRGRDSEREVELLRMEVWHYRVGKKSMARQTLATLICSKSTALAKGALVAWWHLRLKLARERDLERLRQDVLHYQVGKESIARRTVAILIGSKSSVLAKGALVVWRQSRQELLRERDMERLREEVLRHRVGKESMARRAAASLTGSWSTALAKGTLVAWRQLRQELLRERDMEYLREEVLRYRVGKESMARQTAAAIICSQTSGLAKEILVAWRQVHQEFLRERDMERLKEAQAILAQAIFAQAIDINC